MLNNIMRFDYWDVNRLADEIVNIAQSTALRETLKKNVKDEYAKISWQDAARQCLKLYKISLSKGVIS